MIILNQRRDDRRRKPKVIEVKNFFRSHLEDPGSIGNISQNDVVTHARLREFNDIGQSWGNLECLRQPGLLDDLCGGRCRLGVGGGTGRGGRSGGWGGRWERWWNSWRWWLKRRQALGRPLYPPHNRHRR